MGDCEGVGGLASKGAERWGFWGQRWEGVRAYGGGRVRECRANGVEAIDGSAGWIDTLSGMFPICRGATTTLFSAASRRPPTTASSGWRRLP